jgi:hypothetical protein
LAFVALGAASAARRRAAEPPTRTRRASLAVTGRRTAPARAEVVKLIARRSARIRFDDAPRRPALRVAVDAAAPRAIAASLSIAWPDGRGPSAASRAPTCAETADAIALVIVLALDPAAAARESRAPPRRAPGHRRPDRTGRRRRAAARRTPRATRRKAAPPPARRRAPTKRHHPRRRTVRRRRRRSCRRPSRRRPCRAVAAAGAPLDVGAAFRVASGPAPSLMPGSAWPPGGSAIPRRCCR